MAHGEDWSSQRLRFHLALERREPDVAGEDGAVAAQLGLLEVRSCLASCGRRGETVFGGTATIHGRAATIDHCRITKFTEDESEDEQRVVVWVGCKELILIGCCRSAAHVGNAIALIGINVTLSGRRISQGRPPIPLGTLSGHRR